MLQSGKRFRRYLITAIGVSAIVAAVVTSRAQSSNDKWWPQYGGGPENSRYFASRQITKSNVNQLRMAWNYPYGDSGSVPIAVRGVLYGRGRNGSLIAIDAKSGKELWVRENMGGMTTWGLNYWESADGRDQRLIFSMNSLLQEVDAKTGKSIRTFGTNGVVDLREGIDGRDPATIGNLQSQTPGEVFQNLVILGSAPGEGYMSPPGDIRAYDVLTGKLVWTFHTVPRPGEFGYDTWPKDAYKYIGGTNAWGEFTVDPQRGVVYIPLGSPTYDFYGADRIGANLFGASVVALDARTGKRLWHFQMIHHDLWDLDASAAPQLTTIRQNGRNRDVVVVTNKTGWLYVLDRATGDPIWPIEERAVPKSEMEGEQSWPTQPHPTKPEPYVKHTFTVDDISPYLPPAEAEALRKKLLAADNKGIFTPISLRDTVHVPTSNGGTLFGGTTVNPRTGEFYVVAHENPGILRLLRPGEGRGGGAPQMPPGQQVYQQQCQTCHGPNREGVAESGPALVHVAPDPVNNIVAGAPRYTVEATRTVLATGKGRMPAFPHLTATDTDNLVAFLMTGAGGRGAGGGGGGGRGRGAGPIASGAPPEVIVNESGSAWTRPDAAGGGRGRGAAPYPEGVENFTRYTINEYNTVGRGAKPPYSKIVKYDLNEPGIKWSIGYGDDPELAARGITGTGVPGIVNSVILTESGLLFGAGHDQQIRAWDSDTGKELWSSRFGGSFTKSSPVMYEMDGKQYVLLPAAASAPGRGRGAGPAAAPQGAPAAPAAPMGWIAYALPGR
jgi:quinoprotein glucose dehydrogenase